MSVGTVQGAESKEKQAMVPAITEHEQGNCRGSDSKYTLRLYSYSSIPSGKSQENTFQLIA